MKESSIVLAIIFFVLSIFSLTLSYSFASDLSDKEIRHAVANLINSRNTVHVQSVGIQRNDQGQLNLEISANLGNCWGKEELAKGFSREALKALFTSDLNISQVVLRVYGSTEILMTIVLGTNQAHNLSWEKKESLNLFFERMKSNMNYSGNPADYCWLIENYSTKR